MKDKDNYDYLRGFIDGQGSDGHKDSLPEGFNNINEVMDRMHELEGWKKDKETFDNILEVITNKIINIEVGETKIPSQRKCKIVLSNGDRIMFPVSSFDEKKWEEL